MTSTGKTVFAVVVILIVLAVGGTYLYMRAMSPATTGSMATTTTSAVPAGAGSAANASLPGGSSDSDAALNQDTAAIDSQMNGLSSDSADANTSVTQPSAQ